MDINPRKMASCAKCNGIATLSCSKCLSVKYCSRECQKQHWLIHKQTCIEFDREGWNKAKKICNNGFYAAVVGSLCYHVKLKENQILSCILAPLNGDKFLVYLMACIEDKSIDQSYVPGYCNIITNIPDTPDNIDSKMSHSNLVIKPENCKSYYESLSIQFSFSNWKQHGEEFCAILDLKNNGFIPR